MHPVRIACVRYLNTAPLIEGLDKLAGVTLVPAVPSHIAALVASGDADLGLVSIVDAVGLPGSTDPGLCLVPAGMIGCDGPTLTVRLFSAVPLNQITHLHADTDSHTSIILAQVLLARLFNIKPQVVGFDARERIAVPLEQGSTPPPQPNQATVDLAQSWPTSVLLIGDKVVTDRPPEARYPYQLDLGEAWKGLTGLPFVYAVWMCRAAAADSQTTRTAAAILDRQRRHNTTRLDWLIATRAQQARWPLDQARKYVGQLLRYQVGPREREAAARFLSEAADLNLVARRELRWATN